MDEQVGQDAEWQSLILFILLIHVQFRAGRPSFIKHADRTTGSGRTTAPTMPTEPGIDRPLTFTSTSRFIWVGKRTTPANRTYGRTAGGWGWPLSDLNRYPFREWILSPSRLPIPPRGRESNSREGESLFFISLPMDSISASGEVFFGFGGSGGDGGFGADAVTAAVVGRQALEVVVEIEGCFGTAEKEKTVGLHQCADSAQNLFLGFMTEVNHDVADKDQV
jgi:hypothetical protein